VAGEKCANSGLRRNDLIACELGPEEVQRRRATWRDVRRQVQVVERTRVAKGFRIVFRGPQSVVEAVESLVAAERECCSWGDWQVQAIGDRTVLQVTGPDALIEELALAFGFG
jgi:hypothetical protein